MKRDGDSRDVQRVDRRWQVLYGSGTRMRGRMCTRRETTRELAPELVREDRSEDCILDVSNSRQ